MANLREINGGKGPFGNEHPFLRGFNRGPKGAFTLTRRMVSKTDQKWTEMDRSDPKMTKSARNGQNRSDRNQVFRPLSPQDQHVDQQVENTITTTDIV